MCRHLLSNEPGHVVIGHSPDSAKDSVEIKALRGDCTNKIMDFVCPKWRDTFYVNPHLPTTEESSDESISASFPKYSSSRLGDQGNWNYFGSAPNTNVEAAKLTITVNMPSGNSQRVVISPRQSVIAINEFIEKMEEIPTTKQRLLFGRNRLSWGSLESYGIQQGDTIDCFKEQVGC
jgi:hypothetical protein